MPLIVGPGSAVERRILLATATLSDAATLAVAGGVPIIPGFEVALLQTHQLYEKWRAVPTGPTLQLLCDFGTPRTVRLFSLIGTNAKSDTTLRVTAASGSGILFSAPDIFDTAASDPTRLHWPVAGLDTWRATLSFLLLDSAITARYVGFEIGNAGAFYEAGRLLVANPFVPTLDVQDGDSLALMDPSPGQQGLGGQTFVDRRGARRRYQFSVKFTDRQEAMAAHDVERLQGLAGDVLVCRDPVSPVLHHETFYGRFAELPALTNTTIGLVEYPFVVEELL